MIKIKLELLALQICNNEKDYTSLETQWQIDSPEFEEMTSEPW